MYNFWDNIYKFPRFLIAVFLGFFLTTFQPTFKLLKKKKVNIIIIPTIIIIISLLYKLIKIMLGLN
uniref:Uncharacterized protein ycf33 n=1 Tax=Spermothamnion repens TaxID=31383 RepID=A0A4D6X1A9_9FLOR|nr:hypothetical protein [Spermothamnion repens]